MTKDPTDADGPQEFTRDRLTFLAYGMAIAFGYTVAALGPAMPLLRDELNMSRTVGGLHFTALAAGSVLAGSVVGRIVRVWGRHRLFWSGGAGVAAGAVLIGAGWHPAITMFGCLVAGVSGSAVLITVQASLSDHHSLHRPVALTEANMSTSIGTVIAPLLIGGSIAVGIGWRPAFFAPSAIFVALFLLLRFEVFPSSGPLQPLRGGRVLPSPYWFFWLAFIPAVGAEWCVGAWGADYLVTVAGTAKGIASFLMSAFFGAMVLGRFLGGRLARGIRPLSLLLGTTAIGFLGTLVLRGSSTLPGIVVGLFLAGLGISMLFPMLLALAIGTAPDRSDIAAARIAIAAGGSVIVAPLTLGVLADQVGIRSAFSMVPGLLVFVALFAALGRRSSRAAEVSQPHSSGTALGQSPEGS